MDLLLQDGSVITGDGSPALSRADVLVNGGLIMDIDPSCRVHRGLAGIIEVIDALGCTIIPGIINAHGCICGPSMPSGSVGVKSLDVEYNRIRHLLQGTTTLLNVCGLAFPDEIDRAPATAHPMDIHVSTAHTQSNIQAAIAIDGAGLAKRHVQATIDQMLSQGAKALGEVGGGQTLGGGAQEYKFIPEAIRRQTGITIDPAVARQLKNAIVGRYLDPSHGVSHDVLSAVLKTCGLAGKIKTEQVRQIVIASVMPSVSKALTGFEEIAIQSARVGYPAIFHNAVPTAGYLIALAEKYPTARIVAGHCNHPSFLPDEADNGRREAASTWCCSRRLDTRLHFDPLAKRRHQLRCAYRVRFSGYDIDGLCRRSLGRDVGGHSPDHSHEAAFHPRSGHSSHRKRRSNFPATGRGPGACRSG